MIQSKKTGTLSLPVMEHFYTLQGEGFHQGKAAYFIRLGGCDVGCVWCDVKDSWDMDAHPKMSVDELVNAVLNNSSPMGVPNKGNERSLAKIWNSENRGEMRQMINGFLQRHFC